MIQWVWLTGRSPPQWKMWMQYWVRWKKSFWTLICSVLRWQHSKMHPSTWLCSNSVCARHHILRNCWITLGFNFISFSDQHQFPTHLFLNSHSLSIIIRNQPAEFFCDSFTYSLIILILIWRFSSLSHKKQAQISYHHRSVNTVYLS